MKEQIKQYTGEYTTEEEFWESVDLNKYYKDRLMRSKSQTIQLDILSKETNKKGFTIKDLWFNRTKSANESFKVDNNFKSKITVK